MISNMSSLSRTPFAISKRWLRPSAMLSMTRASSDLTLNVEKAPRMSNASFPNDQRLGDKEEVKTARRCAEASISHRKKDLGTADRKNGKDDERPCASKYLCLL